MAGVSFSNATMFTRPAPSVTAAHESDFQSLVTQTVRTPSRADCHEFLKSALGLRLISIAPELRFISKRLINILWTLAFSAAWTIRLRQDEVCTVNSGSRRNYRPGLGARCQ